MDRKRYKFGRNRIKMGQCCNAADSDMDKTQVTVIDKDELIHKFNDAGQGHIFSGWSNLN